MSTLDAKRFAIPAIQGIALLTTAACSPDPVIGTWAATSFLDYTGTTLQLPFLYDYSYNGYDYTYRLEMFITMDSRGFGYFDIYRGYLSGPAVIEATTYAYALYGDKINRGRWAMSIPDFFRLELDCVADRNQMNCIGSDVDGFAYDIDLVNLY